MSRIFILRIFRFSLFFGKTKRDGKRKKDFHKDFERIGFRNFRFSLFFGKTKRDGKRKKDFHKRILRE